MVIETANGGIDRVKASFACTLPGHVEALFVGGTVRFGTGNALPNTIVGNGAANYLSGGAGNDTIMGLAGNDTLVGNRGADRLIGGAGNDTYITDTHDTIVETSAQDGYDTVITSRDIVLGAHLEKVVVTGDAAVSVTGNALDNMLIGNGAANVISGGGGNDVMFGGAGRDVFVFSSGDSGRVRDFQNNIDVIRIDRGDAGGLSAAAVIASATESDGGVTIALAGGVIRIDGITAAALQDDLIIA